MFKIALRIGNFNSLHRNTCIPTLNNLGTLTHKIHKTFSIHINFIITYFSFKQIPGNPPRCLKRNLTGVRTYYLFLKSFPRGVVKDRLLLPVIKLSQSYPFHNCKYTDRKYAIFCSIKKTKIVCDSKHP